MESPYDDEKTSCSRGAWKSVKDATGYIVFSGDRVVGMTRGMYLTLPQYPVMILQVCAVNQYGSLGNKAILSR